MSFSMPKIWASVLLPRNKFCHSWFCPCSQTHPLEQWWSGSWCACWGIPWPYSCTWGSHQIWREALWSWHSSQPCHYQEKHSTLCTASNLLSGLFFLTTQSTDIPNSPVSFSEHATSVSWVGLGKKFVPFLPQLLVWSSGSEEIVLSGLASKSTLKGPAAILSEGCPNSSEFGDR